MKELLVQPETYNRIRLIGSCLLDMSCDEILLSWCNLNNVSLLILQGVFKHKTLFTPRRIDPLQFKDGHKTACIYVSLKTSESDLSADDYEVFGITDIEEFLLCCRY